MNLRFAAVLFASNLASCDAQERLRHQVSTDSSFVRLEDFVVGTRDGKGSKSNSKKPSQPTPSDSCCSEVGEVKALVTGLDSKVTAALDTLLPVTTSPVKPSLDPNPGQPSVTTAAPVQPSGNVTQVAPDSMIAVCRVDREGFYIPSNDPRFNSPDTVDVNTDAITFSEVSAELDTITDAFDGIATTIDLVGDLANLSGKFATIASAIGGGAAVLSAGFAILGPLFGLKSMDDVILEAIQEGFRQVNSRLLVIQLQIREGFLKVSELIGDVTLDELVSLLDSTGRVFNDYVNAKQANRAAFHEPRLRAVCNEPFKTPQDVFYNLYGYVCKECKWASRKRAKLAQIAKDQNELSERAFFDAFGSFILRSMAQAMFLHTVCLPPIEGACADLSADETWASGVMDMEQAYNEAKTQVFDIVEDLSNFANNIKRDNIIGFVTGKDDNQIIADSIRDFLLEAQPAFHFQVIVASSGERLYRTFYWRRSCNRDEQECQTRRDGTGHFHFDNLEGKSISIRYRLRSLDPAPTTVSIGGQEIGFPDFYQGLANKIRTEKADVIRAITTEECGTEDRFRGIIVRACLVNECFYQCNDEEQAALDGIVDLFYIHTLDMFSQR